MNKLIIPNENESIEFLSNINPGFSSRVFSIHPVSGKIIGRIFIPQMSNELRNWLSEGAGKLNYYYLPNLPFAEFSPRKPKKSDMEWVTHLYVDVDHVAPEYLEALQIHFPAPSCIVFSGGGYQALWKLDKPTQDFARAEHLNKVLASRLNGDSCHSVDHLMRLPGTINVPNAKKAKNGRVPTLAYVVQS